MRLYVSDSPRLYRSVAACSLRLCRRWRASRTRLPGASMSAKGRTISVQKYNRGYQEKLSAAASFVKPRVYFAKRAQLIEHDNQNNGDNILCCTSCSHCRQIKIHDNLYNNNNSLCCLRCNSCRQIIYTRQPIQQQLSLLYKLSSHLLSAVNQTSVLISIVRKSSARMPPSPTIKAV